MKMRTVAAAVLMGAVLFWVGGHDVRAQGLVVTGPGYVAIEHRMTVVIDDGEVQVTAPITLEVLTGFEGGQLEQWLRPVVTGPSDLTATMVAGPAQQVTFTPMLRAGNEMTPTLAVVNGLESLGYYLGLRYAATDLLTALARLGERMSAENSGGAVWRTRVLIEVSAVQEATQVLEMLHPPLGLEDVQLEVMGAAATCRWLAAEVGQFMESGDEETRVRVSYLAPLCGAAYDEMVGAIARRIED